MNSSSGCSAAAARAATLCATWSVIVIVVVVVGMTSPVPFNSRTATSRGRHALACPPFWGVRQEADRFGWTRGLVGSEVYAVQTVFVPRQFRCGVPAAHACAVGCLLQSEAIDRTITVRLKPDTTYGRELRTPNPEPRT